MIEFITLMSLFLVAYHHVIYPLLLAWLGDRQGRSASESSAQKLPNEPAQWPRIELLIPAYNEQDYVADKLWMLAFLDYPAERLSIRLLCDGCTDDTVSVARQTLTQLPFCEFSIEVAEYANNRGKVALLNEAIAASTADIVALSDVSAIISVDAMKMAARHFQLTDVGVVCGSYQLLNPGSDGEAKYWQYQRKVRQNEANLGALQGAHGAFYLIRREAFCTLKSDTINDDFMLPMNIVAQGYRGVYEPTICALELEHASDALDRKRRRRIGAGNLQQLIRLRQLLLPRFKGVAFTFVSGKALRVLCPFLVLASMVGAALLASNSIWFAGLLALQVLGIALALLPRLNPSYAWPSLLKALNYLIEGHWNCLLGCISYVQQSVMRRLGRA
ncbi:glycosyltransferase family 2 protein [Neiella marina]|uniref:Glycosyltransferase family 2 protein n=1 Tax=Neiella holothuriorum TaxID=2870530 RepID=A0ABS7EJL1_9GAMM|nr:glycosyltransferase family 2 protein [Neiella holothuriorum]MBW8192480.1 glycosyltransferase family 2 protein [Neiella holothuriorum]